MLNNNLYTSVETKASNFEFWSKEQPCIITNHHGPSLIHKPTMSKFFGNVQIVKPWFLIPLCSELEEIFFFEGKTLIKKFGKMSDIWHKHINNFLRDKDHNFNHPSNKIIEIVKSCGL